MDSPDDTCTQNIAEDGPFEAFKQFEAVEDVALEAAEFTIPSLHTLLMFFVGSAFLGRLFASEYRLFKQKKEHNFSIPFTWYDLIQYRLGYYVSRDHAAKPILLLSLTFILIFSGGVLLKLAGSDFTLDDGIWVAWTYVADPGTHADAEGTLVRLVSFLLTIGGMLVFALMIGIVSEAIGDWVDGLKKGTSRVIETDHTLILGWTDKSLAIIQQIALANESEGGGVIVVLADCDKEEMEATLYGAVDSTDQKLRLLGTDVVFRSGNTLLERNLKMVSIQTARSIIALSPDGVDPNDADSLMVRQVLSIKRFENIQSHVAVEMQDIDNKELIQLVAPEIVEVIVAHDVIGRLMIQCAREPGLAYVLESLMGFEGDEFYIESWPELVGMTFWDITCRFDEAIPVGIKTSDGHILINPENEYVIKKGDGILVLAEDNDTYSVNDGRYRQYLQWDKAPIDMHSKPPKEKLLFCGWRRDMADMIMQLDECVAEGSVLWLFNTVPTQERNELLKDKGHKDELDLKNLTIMNAVGNPIIKRDLLKLEALDNNGRPTGDTTTLDEFDSLLILADAIAIENGADMESLDSRSLASLLIIQELQRQLIKEKKLDDAIRLKCDPISEILDTRTRSLLEVANCKSYVMSNQIVSAAIALVAENRDMRAVLGELLTAEGSEAYLRDVSHYLDLPRERKASFWDVALRARQKREVALGFKPRRMSYQEADEFLLNPPAKDELKVWVNGDIIIALALD